MTVPFVLPTVVVAGAFTEVFSVTGLDDGALRLRHTVWAILITHVFFNYAVVVRAVGGYWSSLDHQVEEAARVLGARPWAVFREVTLPRLRPAIASAAPIVFLFSFTSFGVVLILGGPRRATLETEIYRQAVTRTDLRDRSCAGGRTARRRAGARGRVDAARTASPIVTTGCSPAN